MKINVRMEGGFGDHLAANRFIPAILEKYPSGQIKLFSDTENNGKSLKTLLKLFPDFYERGGEVIAKRASKNFNITSQFGEENYPCAIENQLNETIEKMVNQCDLFYDLHIDGLKWMYHDYDWLRYYFHFPRPKGFEIKNNNFVLCHLYARPNSVYNLEQWYVESLLKELSKTINIKIITEESYIDYYSNLKNIENIEILTPNILEIFNLASQCSLFIGIDSGIRYVPYHFSKPTFVFSKYCSGIGSVAYSHLIRWLIFKNQVLPIHYDINKTLKIINNSLNNEACYLFPEIIDNFDLHVVNRKYEIKK
jgi:hypothetical protein